MDEVIWLLQRQNKLLESMMAQMDMILPPEPPPIDREDPIFRIEGYDDRN